MSTARRYQRELPPDCFPRAAFKLADLLDEMVAMGPEGRAALREKNDTPIKLGGSPKEPTFCLADHLDAEDTP